MVNLKLLYNSFFLSILSISVVYSTRVLKDNFLSFSNHDNLNADLFYTSADKNIYDLILAYRKKIFKNSIFDDLIKDRKLHNSSSHSRSDSDDFDIYIEEKKNELSKYHNLEDDYFNIGNIIQNEKKIVEKKILESILLEKNSQNSNIEEFFNTKEFIWEKLNSQGEVPKPRRGHSMVLIESLIVIFGGSDLNNNFYNDLYIFDLLKNTWMKINHFGDIPSPRAEHSAVVYGTTIWIFGGASRDGYLNDLYSFNIETHQWKKHEFTGKSPKLRSGHSAIIDEQAKIYIFGGYSGKEHANDIFVINILQERYENPLTSGKPPAAREKSVMILIEKNIFIYGGHQSGIVYNDLWKLNMINLLWEKVNISGFIPQAYQGLTGERVGKKLYVTGGCDYENKFCNKDTYILDTVTLHWTKLSDLQKNSTIASNYLNSTGENYTIYSSRSHLTMEFFRGGLVGFGGCDMNKECFNDLYVLKINDMCPNSCSGNGQCRSKFGCECKNDFIQHDCSLKIKCKDDCNKNGICKSNAKCDCFPGWKDLTCGIVVNCPKNCTSTESGVCQLDGTCKCNKGYLGKECSNNTNLLNVDPIEGLINLNNKNINKKNDELKSSYNTTIEISPSSCKNDCSGHGECNLLLKSCTCKNGYTGDDCSQKIEHLEIEPKPKPLPVVKPPPKRIVVKEEKKWRSYWINNTFYLENDGCVGACNQKGICLNSTCVCDQGFTGINCSQTYREVIEVGFVVKNYTVGYVIVGGIAMVLVLLYFIFVK